MALVNLRREAQRSIGAERFSSFILIFCLFSILAQASLILFVWGKLPGQLPIFYSRPWGEELLGKPLNLWLLPLILVLTVAVNYLLAIFITGTNRFLLRILSSFSFLVALTTFYDVVKIISLLT